MIQENVYVRSYLPEEAYCLDPATPNVRSSDATSYYLHL